MHEHNTYLEDLDAAQHMRHKVLGVLAALSKIHKINTEI